jgi:hypothetical protein
MVALAITPELSVMESKEELLRNYYRLRMQLRYDACCVVEALHDKAVRG